MLHEIQHGPPGFPLGVYVNRISADAPTGTRFIYTHYHHHLEFIWVRSGAFRFDLESEGNVVEEGDVLIVGSDRIHGGSSLEGIACDVLSVVFDVRMLYGDTMPDRSATQFLASLTEQRYTLPTRLPASSELGAKLRSHLSRLAEVHVDPEPGAELMIKALLLQCFYELARAGAYVRARGDEQQRSDRHAERVREILLYIDAHLAEKLPVAHLAARLHLSPAHFHALFRKYTGQSPVEYINSLRLARSHALLSSSESITTQEAAHRVGFENVSYFIKCFKRRYGVTPMGL